MSKSNKKKTLLERQPKTGNGILSYARKHPAFKRERVVGSHHIVETDRGGVSVPVHGNVDLQVGIRKAIYKQLAAIGITVLVVGLLVGALWM